MSQPVQAEIARPDIISVYAEYEEEIPAVRADLHIAIKGASLVTGHAALDKAREVRQLVTDLKNFGLSDSDIKLQSVHAEVSSGMLGKSSSANYSLIVRCSELEQLADILGIVTGQKNTKLRQIEWGYEDNEEAEDRWLARCIERASQKAKIVAAGLGVKLIGIHHFIEHSAIPRELDRSGRLYEYEGMRGKANASSGFMRREDLGLEVSHTKIINVFIEVQYRISEFINP